jgi:predicted RNA methylase
MSEPSNRPNPQRLAEEMRAGHCPPDEVFDLLLPEEWRAVADQYWTTIEVIERVVEWLEAFDIKSVVDIGSGSGKFCVVAAILGKSRFIGLEQRPLLVKTARDLAQLFELGERVTFIEGVFGEDQLPEAEAYYLYNPFGENLFAPDNRLDEEVELSNARYVRDTEATKKMLQRARPGTFLITYNGFGGQIPSNYHEVRVDRSQRNVLRMWRKTNHPDRESPHSSNGI